MVGLGFSPVGQSGEHWTRGLPAYQAKRVDILDRNGVVLATNLETSSLYADPKKVQNPEAAVQSMFGYHEQGFTTWDLADHYGPAEDFIGEFRRRLAESQGEDALQGMQAFTKWVPSAGPMTLPIVRENVGLSLRRMGVEAIDLLQFHWWDYQDPAYLDALVHLSQLRDEGLIKHVALTNFDTERLERISAHGVTVVSNQVQYSLIDRRPEIQMVPFCLDHHVQLL
ncbi:MAG: aldo/keto reductase, partial [Proteobacteria bacterium]|nr:aldo/keto reductase [Pseudomonadota bacterium]